MNIKTIELKDLIKFIALHTEDLDTSGRPEVRRQIARKHFRAYKSLLKKFDDDMVATIETGDGSPVTAETLDAIREIIKLDKLDEKTAVKSLSFSDNEIELSADEISFIKDCWSRFDYIPNVSIESFDALEELCK